MDIFTADPTILTAACAIHNRLLCRGNSLSQNCRTASERSTHLAYSITHHAPRAAVNSHSSSSYLVPQVLMLERDLNNTRSLDFQRMGRKSCRTHSGACGPTGIYLLVMLYYQQSFRLVELCAQAFLTESLPGPQGRSEVHL